MRLKRNSTCSHYSGCARLPMKYVFAYSHSFALLARLGLVAQSVEQRTENPCVGGSIPPRATKYMGLQRCSPFSFPRNSCAKESSLMSNSAEETNSSTPSASSEGVVREAQVVRE